VTMQIKQLQQQLASSTCDTSCVEMLGAQIQGLQTFLLSLQASQNTTIANWEWIFMSIVGEDVWFSPSQAQAWIAANPGLGGTIGAAGVQKIINQLSLAQSLMYAGPGGNPPPSYLLPGTNQVAVPASCNSWQYYF